LVSALTHGRCPDQLVQLQYKSTVPWLLSGYGFIPSRANDVSLPSEVHHNPWVVQMPYPLQSHGTTITDPLISKAMAEARRQASTVYCN